MDHLRELKSAAPALLCVKFKNVAVAAVARELACFIWGMATGNTGLTRQAQASAKAGI
jgi:hypothetical protein